MINVSLNRSPCTWFPHILHFLSSKECVFVKSPCSHFKLNPWRCSSNTIIEALSGTCYFSDTHTSNATMGVVIVDCSSSKQKLSRPESTSAQNPENIFCVYYRNDIVITM